MKSVLNWTEGMKFTATSDNHSVDMDAKSPIGKGSAITPKELVLAGLGGCTAMDVIALMRKHKQEVQSFEVEVDAPTIKGTPVMFEKADIYFRATGNIDPKILLESVQLSQTKYCGVSAMMLKAFPIHYHVFLNNEAIGEGDAHFA